MQRIQWQLQWAKRNPLFWWNLAIAGIAVPLVLYATSDLHVRALGVFLELVGVATVWTDLTRSAKKTGRAGALGGTLAWLKAGIHGPKTHIATGTIGGGWSVLGGRASMRHGVPDDADLSLRVSALEKNLAALDRELGQFYADVQRIEAEARGSIAREQEIREREIDKLRSDLADFASGSYSTLLFGVVWLCVGMVLSGFPDEILNLVQRAGA